MVLRPEFVERKLQLITEELARLSEFRPATYESLVGDSLRLAAIERVLERIIVRAIDVNEHIISALATGEEGKTTRLSYRDTFLKLADYGVYPEDFASRIAPSAGLRNILIHAYNDIDHRILYDSIHNALEQYITYVEYVRRFLMERSAGGGPAQQ
ncbi:MAG: type VII toxin-antitoxin system HepT family RNase toxin [Longimicrobiales bacterium]